MFYLHEMKYEMFLTYVFFGIFLIFCCDDLFSVMVERSSMKGIVMVAPDHLTFRDRMSCPSLGDINTQLSPLADFTATSRRTGWQRYHQFPCPPKSPTRIFTKFHSNLHCRRPDVSLQRSLPHPVYLLLSATIPHHYRSLPTI
jgi:hypothetical protein